MLIFQKQIQVKEAQELPEMNIRAGVEAVPGHITSPTQADSNTWAPYRLFLTACGCSWCPGRYLYLGVTVFSKGQLAGVMSRANFSLGFC